MGNQSSDDAIKSGTDSISFEQFSIKALLTRVTPLKYHSTFFEDDTIVKGSFGISQYSYYYEIVYEDGTTLSDYEGENEWVYIVS